MIRLICLIENCGKFGYAQGYCRNHYTSLMRRGKLISRAKEHQCHCGSKVAAKDLCRKHYYLKYERISKKEYNPKVKTTRAICKKQGCSNLILAKEYCSKHYFKEER